MFAPVKDWTRFVPLVAVAKGYRRDDFRHDLLAGLTVAVVTVPQAVAYAFLAGLPAEAGLYACLAPMVIYAVLGSSRQLVVGPVAVAALMVAAAVGTHAPAHSEAYLAITSVLCLQVGLVLWGLRALQLAGIVNLLSHPVVGGFVNAAALLIVLSQLPAFSGIALEVHGAPLDVLTGLAQGMDGVNGAAVAIGAISLIVLMAVQRGVAALTKRDDHPLGRGGPMLVVVVATAAAALLAFDVATVGDVPAGLPSFTSPSLNFALWVDLAPSAAAIALVAYVESFTIGATLAERQRQRIDPAQELVALGAANVGAAFTGAYPVAGSFSRSSVNRAAGARTPMSSLVCAVAIAATLLWLTPLFQHLPHAALAAIVIASVVSLLDFSALREQWRFYPADVAAHLATLIGVLLLGVEAGLLLGISVAVMLFARRSSRPHIAVLGRLGDSAHFRNVARFEATTHPTAIAVRVDENLYFANARQVEARLLEIAAAVPGANHLVLMCGAINFIDATGLETLRRLDEGLAALGLKLHLSDVKGPVRDQLAAIHFAEELSGRIYLTLDEAMAELGGKPV